MASAGCPQTGAILRSAARERAVEQHPAGDAAPGGALDRVDRLPAGFIVGEDAIEQVYGALRSVYVLPQPLEGTAIIVNSSTFRRTPRSSQVAGQLSGLGDIRRDRRLDQRRQWNCCGIESINSDSRACCSDAAAGCTRGRSKHEGKAQRGQEMSSSQARPRRRGATLRDIHQHDNPDQPFADEVGGAEVSIELSFRPGKRWRGGTLFPQGCGKRIAS